MTQPPRSPLDGAVSVERITETGELLLAATHAGGRMHIRCSEHNAWRLFVMLGVLLGASLPSKLLKSVKL